MGFGTFVKKNLVGIIGIIIGVFGFAFALYSHLESLEERIPVFIVDPARTEIINNDRVTAAPIKVSRLSGEEIHGDITSLRFYFWNDGARSIKAENVLRPISLSFEDSTCDIIDFKAIKISRDVTGIMLNLDSSGTQKQLNLSFDILERNDGLMGQIIYRGNKHSDLKILGCIEGVDSLTLGYTPRKIIYAKKYLNHVFKGFKFCIKGLGIGFLGGILVFLLNRIYQGVVKRNLSYKHLFEGVLSLKTWSSAMKDKGIILFIIIMIIIAPLVMTYNEISNKLIQNIPDTLLLYKELP